MNEEVAAKIKDRIRKDAEHACLFVDQYIGVEHPTGVIRCSSKAADTWEVIVSVIDRGNSVVHPAVDEAYEDRLHQERLVRSAKSLENVRAMYRID